MGYPQIEAWKDVQYTIPFSGVVLNYNGDPVYTEFSFSSENYTKTIKTDKNGNYSGTISPGVYDIKAKFSSSAEVNLLGASIEERDLKNIIIYNYYGNLDVLGIRSAGTYFFDISPSFSRGTIRMQYSQNLIKGEIFVYRCDWDKNKRTCLDGDEINFDLDERNNQVEVKAYRSSAYIIGTKKSLDPTFSSDKNTYYLGEIITINGVVRDDIHESVGDATVNCIIEGTSISSTLKSSSNGIVSFKITAPTEEGNYTIKIETTKESYEPSEKEIKIEVVEKKDISIVAPDTIRVEVGKPYSLDVSLVNIGQGALSEILFSIDGIPKEYYSFEGSLGYLDPGEEKKIPIKFLIPENSSEGTFAGKFKVEFEGKSKEKIFGFTILPKSVEAPKKNETESIPTGKFTLPKITISSKQIIYSSVLILASFSIAFTLKKLNRQSKKDDISKIFSEIKSQLTRGEEQASGSGG